VNDRALVPVRPGELATPAEQPIDFEGLLKVGAMLAKSGFFPDAKVEAQAVAKILAGAELGVGPVASLRGIDLINGKLAPNAGLISALIKRRRPAYDFRVIENTNQRCELAFYEHGREVGRSSFSADDAKTALLTEGNWKKFPRNMMFARALTNGARWYCADIFLGGVYVPEELGETGEDYDPPPAWVNGETDFESMAGEAPAPLRKAASAQPAAAGTWQDRPATEPQIKAIYALARGTPGMDDGTLEEWCRNRYGVTPGEMTRRECAETIDLLRAAAGQLPEKPKRQEPPAEQPKRNGGDPAQKAFWGTAQNLGYVDATGRVDKMAVHRALGLPERDGALTEHMESERLSWNGVARQLHQAGRYKPAAVEVERLMANEYGDPADEPPEDDAAQPAMFEVERQHGDPVDGRRS
jgi:hypothetical protein